MITIRKSADRAHFDHGWLDTHHSFSFAEYYDPANMGFRALRVINEDVVQAGQGFGTHGHRDMEIVTWVLEGALEHKDSLGSGEILRPGEIQRMSAGTGVRHSEFNASKTDKAHLLQIWLEPERRGLPPSYEQKTVPTGNGPLTLLAAPAGKGGVVEIHQDAALYLARLAAGDRVRHELAAGRHAWVQVTRGALRVGDHLLGAGDGAAISGERAVELAATDSAAEALVFDLA